MIFSQFQNLQNLDVNHGFFWFLTEIVNELSTPVYNLVCCLFGLFWTKINRFFHTCRFFLDELYGQIYSEYVRGDFCAFFGAFLRVFLEHFWGYFWGYFWRHFWSIFWRQKVGTWIVRQKMLQNTQISVLYTPSCCHAAPSYWASAKYPVMLLHHIVSLKRLDSSASPQNDSDRLVLRSWHASGWRENKRMT